MSAKNKQLIIKVHDRKVPPPLTLKMCLFSQICTCVHSVQNVSGKLLLFLLESVTDSRMLRSVYGVEKVLKDAILS